MAKINMLEGLKILQDDNAKKIYDEYAYGNQHQLLINSYLHAQHL